ncbi:DUF4253 domain-containing protein [Bacillus sp. ISL-45]|uniref:DUF4253 domain-containing protein n=1 Tax=Bacillus sp. ISL-45 TaxID=2819128 RepID=UPI001BE6E9AC|nr:DUF4253 domain-containing protein [Bacillus sp. ISL-45]MBT2660046.1 DUF4253 domain-containing protein [Bacillus sp. ISL-45]
MNWKKLLSFGKSKENNINIEKCGISEEAMTIVRRNSDGKLHPFYKGDLYTEKRVEIAGIYVDAKQAEAELLVLKLREELMAINYLAFICDSEREKIGIIPGSDQFEILQLQQTNGDNYNISNERVISKLREWHSSHPFTVIGADYDWVEANFDVLPEGKELKTLAREIAEFCPDIVEQGTGSINGLIEAITETKKMDLWWD